MAKRKTREQIERIIAQVQFNEEKFVLLSKGDGFLLQLTYHEKDIETGKLALQKSRKHYISPFMTETEIVDTVFYCVLRSVEHRVREHFLYKGERVRSPHFSIEARISMAYTRMFDKRED